MQQDLEWITCTGAAEDGTTWHSHHSSSSPGRWMWTWRVITTSVTNTKVTRCSRNHDSFKKFLPLCWCCKSTFSSSKIHLIILCISITLHALIFCSFKTFSAHLQIKNQESSQQKVVAFSEWFSTIQVRMLITPGCVIDCILFYTVESIFGVPSLRPQTTRYRTWAPSTAAARAAGWATADTRWEL